MIYQFPRITHIDQVREVIAGRKHFRESIIGDIIVVNCTRNSSDTFPSVTDTTTAILRECQGITFCTQSGRVVSRKFHRFFSVNEREDTQAGNIDLSRPHVILEKLDGTMISPFLRHDGTVEWHTKVGTGHTTEHVNWFVRAHPGYAEFAATMIKGNLTPLFEFCSNKAPVVVFHPMDRLVLLGIRENNSGAYLPYRRLEELAENYDLELVKEFPGKVDSMKALLQHTHGLTGTEGYVLRFEDDGHMVKVKGDWYSSLRKAADGIIHHKDIWNHVLNGTATDLKSFLSFKDCECLDDFENRFWNKMDYHAASLAKVMDYKAKIDTIHASLSKEAKRQIFAEEYAKSFGALQSLAFHVFDGDNPHETLTAWVAKQLAVPSRFQKLQQASLFANLKYQGNTSVGRKHKFRLPKHQRACNGNGALRESFRST